jgi:gamma-glutamyl-gamma-aminobutyrate hydrolase PuuD
MSKYILIAPPKGDTELETYIEWVERNGFIPVVLEDECQNIDGPLLLCGGSDIGVNVKRDQRELRWIELALENNQPIIGICRGMQIINHYFGGDVENISEHYVDDHQSENFADDSDHSARKSHFHWVMDLDGARFRVNSRHHQVCSFVPENLVPTHMSLGSGYLIEGFEDLKRKIWAVQWHPERMESMNNVYPLNKLK